MIFLKMRDDSEKCFIHMLDRVSSSLQYVKMQIWSNSSAAAAVTTATQHLQQTLASQIANVGSKLHSQLMPGANAVRASQLYSKEGTFLLSYEQRRVY